MPTVAWVLVGLTGAAAVGGVAYVASRPKATDAPAPAPAGGTKTPAVSTSSIASLIGLAAGGPAGAAIGGTVGAVVGPSIDRLFSGFF